VVTAMAQPGERRIAIKCGGGGSGYRRRTHHLQHASNSIVARAAAFNEGRALDGLPVVARATRFGLRHVGERWIVLAVVAAHFVNHEVERWHQDQRESVARLSISTASIFMLLSYFLSLKPC
jgi:hypothetical protein